MTGRIVLKHKINCSRFPYSTRKKSSKTAKDNKVTKEAIKIAKKYSQKEGAVLKRIIKFKQLQSTARCSSRPDTFVDMQYTHISCFICEENRARKNLVDYMQHAWIRTACWCRQGRQTLSLQKFPLILILSLGSSCSITTYF